MASKSQSERIAAIVKRPEAKAFYLAHGAYSSLLKAWTHVLTNDRLAPMVSPKMRKTVASIRVNIDEVLQEWEMLLAGEEPEAGKEELHALIRDVTEIVLRIANSRTHRRGNESEVQYRPARWFTKGSAPRLRMAARDGRKTKHVRSKKIDGTKCYLVADVRLWWPELLPASERKGATPRK